MPYAFHKVSCKAALFNRNRQKVLLVEYDAGNFGLPGGHLERDEAPEAAVRRETREELGIDYRGELHRADFWIHPHGKVILAYWGVLDGNTSFYVDEEEIRGARWTDVGDIKAGRISAGTYDDFILHCSKS